MQSGDRPGLQSGDIADRAYFQRVANWHGSCVVLRERITARRSSSPIGRSSNPPLPAPETVNALRSLGYLSGSTSSGPLESRVNPKDRTRDFEQYGRALALASAGKLAESNDLLEKLRDELPEVADIWISLEPATAGTV